ncbi:DUF4136 domain-containing protein [Pleomorphovibrio marinus]|uniref:DUF4136 domain-containing protein n=1 Tax=Pleomorphovibrio marinus TaxID=2164132 RepID=UPI000E0B743F|nr:DUF4136 domain-containing protein [Pleomorphovibrio marinus]
MIQHVIMLMAVMCVSCQSTKISVLEQSPEFKLANYDTFGFYNTETTGVLSDNYQRNIDFLQEEIAKQMAFRGIMITDEDPELMINLGVLVEKKDQTRETNLATDPGTFNYIGQQRYTWKAEQIKVGSYRKGTVTVHLVDAKQNKALWVAVTERILSEKEDRLMQTIKDGVEEMFDYIP